MSFSSAVSNCSVCLGNVTKTVQCNTGGDVIHIIFCSLVILLGVPGNCLILRVYWNKPRKTSTNVLIMGLAWADLFSCILLVHAIITSCVFGIGESPLPLAIWRYFLLCSVGVSVNTTSLIAFDRYDCVCRPNRRLFNYRRAVKAVLAVATYVMSTTLMYFVVLVYPSLVIIPLIMLLSQIIGYSVAAVMILVCYWKVYRTIRHHVQVGSGAIREDTTRETQGKSTQGKVASLTTTSTGTTTESKATSSSNTDSLQGKSIGEMAASNTQPGTSSSSRNGEHNLETDAASGKHHRAEQHDAQHRSDPTFPSNGTNTKQGSLEPNAPAAVLQRKTTRMLLITSVVFLLSWVPYWIYVASLLATLQGSGPSQDGEFVFEKCAYIVYLNNAVNPLIYGLANRRFRKDCKEVFQRFRLC